MSIKEKMDEQIVIYSFKEILLSNKRNEPLIHAKS